MGHSQKVVRTIDFRSATMTPAKTSEPTLGFMVRISVSFALGMARAKGFRLARQSLDRDRYVIPQQFQVLSAHRAINAKLGAGARGKRPGFAWMFGRNPERDVAIKEAASGGLLPGGARRLNQMTDRSIEVQYGDMKKFMKIPVKPVAPAIL
jgi:hypothetical protein